MHCILQSVAWTTGEAQSCAVANFCSRVLNEDIQHEFIGKKSGNHVHDLTCGADTTRHSHVKCACGLQILVYSPGTSALYIVPFSCACAVQVGVYSSYTNGLNIGAFMEKGLSMAAGQTPVQAFWEKLLKLIQEGKLTPEMVITHELPLTEAAKGYQIFNDKEDGCVKVVLKTGA